LKGRKGGVLPTLVLTKGLRLLAQGFGPLHVERMEGQGRRSTRLRRSRSGWDECLALKIVVELGFLGGIHGAFDRATVPEIKLDFTRRIRNSPMDRPLVVPQIKLRPKHDES